MKSIKGKTVLITGASSGIGKAFAFEAAKQGANLILTARSIQKLQDIASQIMRRFGNTVHLFIADLSKKDAPADLYRQISEKGLKTDLLINNAGIGKWTNFLDESSASYEEMLELNINSLVKLTQLVIPGMLERGTGGVINIASTGALQPCPYVAVYCASKSFVLSFSEALYGEYYHRGITVTAVCPGNTATGFQAIAGADTKGMAADTPEYVAKKGLEAFLKGKSFKITGTVNYLQSFLPRLLPRKSVINVVSGMMKKRVEGVRKYGLEVSVNNR
ncbi:hypothetical protein SAMN05518672_10482 [Chitinophaga sp. CF118]|uniref:SDR family NAD(P)-dependent oxidoreductase n=1 Tax=Chitinophaga sp. CF118 TaxID=1884367 RepID=UPI0008E71B82|nr:SDR family oxidoreductase [Chitinophaga sp. CF118]SFD99599.1 hypothetical protein SAMN05518672_10482 [Chitinophaga sp. CF118]